MSAEGFFTTQYNKMKEDYGYHGCLWWILFSIYKLIISRFTLLRTWQFWVFLLGGAFAGALLMIPWYYAMRAISKALTKTGRLQNAYWLRWVLYIIETIYIIFLANLAFNWLFMF